MKKTLLLFVLLCLWPVVALADTIIEIPTPDFDRENDSLSFESYILQNEGTIHLLSNITLAEMREIYDINGMLEHGAMISDHTVSCYELNEKNELIPCQQNCSSLFGVPVVTEDEFGKRTSYPEHPLPFLSSHHTYTSNENEEFITFRQWTPNSENPIQTIAMIPLEQFGEIKSWIRTGASDTTLYFFIDKSEGIFTKNLLYAYDLTSGKMQEIYKSGYSINGIYATDENRMMIADSKGFELLNLSTGKIEKSRKGFSDFVVDIIPDGHDGFYMLGYSGLYKIDQDMQEKCFYQLPDGVQARGSLIYRSDAHDFVFLATNKKAQTCSLYIINEDRSQQNTLNLIDFSNDLGTLNSYAPSMEEFHATHDQFTVATAESITDYDQLNQALVLGNDSFDVMLLDYDALPMANLYKKGYYVDLSDSPAVQDYLASTYPVFRQACMAGDRIAALPLIARDSTMLINQPLWEELGLPIPTTFGELLDTIAFCLDEGILNEHPLFKSTRFELDAQGQVISWDLMVATECYNTLRYQLLQAYVANAQRDGELSFQDETFMQLMDKLHGLKNALDEHDAKRVVGDALLYPDDSLSMVSGSKLYDPDIFRPLLLGVHDAKDIAVPVRLKVLLINPRSPRADLAKEYIAYFAAHPTSTTRCVITTEQPDGIEKPGQLIDKENEAALMADLMARIEAARAENDLLTARDLEEELSQFKENRSFNWDVTPEAAQAYYQITPYLVVMDSENFGFIEENGSRDIAAFDEGRIDAKTLCQRLEQLLMMRRMENQ